MLGRSLRIAWLMAIRILLPATAVTALVVLVTAVSFGIDAAVPGQVTAMVISLPMTWISQVYAINLLAALFYYLID